MDPLATVLGLLATMILFCLLAVANLQKRVRDLEYEAERKRHE